MLAHPDPEVVFLSYNELPSGHAELVVNKTLPLRERNMKPSEFLNDIFVHPSGKLAVVYCYAGRVSLVALERGTYQDHSDAVYAFLQSQDTGH